MSHGRQPEVVYFLFGAFLLLITDGKSSCWTSVAWCYSYKRDGVKTLQKGKKSTSGYRPCLTNVCASAPWRQEFAALLLQPSCCVSRLLKTISLSCGSFKKDASLWLLIMRQIPNLNVHLFLKHFKTKELRCKYPDEIDSRGSIKS